MLILIICGTESVFLLLLCLIRLVMKKRERRRVIRAVRSIMRKNRLENNIRNRRTSEETYQLSKNYLCIEFLRTSPKMLWAFDPTVPVTVGRGKPNVIQLRSRLVSKNHCCIFESEGYIYLQNVGAANPLYFKRGILRRKNYVEPGQCEFLQDKDVIVISEFQMKVHMIWGTEAFSY